MRNLLNCHVVGMHSFPITESDKLFERVFTTTADHHLYHKDHLELAIHPHHVNITITVLKGGLTNSIYVLDELGDQILKEFVFSSIIKNGVGGFKNIGYKRLTKKSETTYNVGESFTMESCEMHTVHVDKGMESAWLVQEDIPTCDYFPVSYSDIDLEKWNQKGMYQPVNDTIKRAFLKGLNYKQYLNHNR